MMEWVALSAGRCGSECVEYSSITERDLRITDIIVKTLKRWNNEYMDQSSGDQKEMPTEEQLAQIEEFKKKGWIK